MSKGVLVTGGDLAGIQTALDLANRGIKVSLLEEASTLGASSPQSSQEIRAALLATPAVLRASHHPNISVLTGAAVERVRGNRGAFKVRIARLPAYVDVDACAGCGRCERECPVNILPPSGDPKEGHKAVHRPGSGLKTVPSAYIIDKKGISPCTAACPAGVNAHGYVALIAQGKFTEALDLIASSVPFPRVLGRVCNHPCETNCTRGKVDKAVSICALKRFVADHSSTEDSLQRAHKSNGAKTNGMKRVAVIGAGPAGLAGARDLARMGYHCTVFEALPVPGGMITVGMPRFRLPREVRQADIEDIIRLGIEIRTSTPIGKDLTIADLKRQGYSAVLIAVGAHKNQKLGITGEGLSGVINSISFLQALNLKQPITVGSKVIVIGGGYTGIDSARAAVRLHCERVLVVDRCAREDLPANADEVAEAAQEGVEFEYLVSPTRIVGAEGKVTGVEFRRMKAADGESGGRHHTVPVEGSEFFIEADTVVVAVGQRPDLSFLEGDSTLNEGKKHIIVDPATMATRIPGIFAAGDAAHDCGPMVNAIGMGRRAAASIDKYLRGEELGKESPVVKITPVEVNVKDLYVPPIQPQEMPVLPLSERTGNFEEVELGFTPESAMREAQRCLNCASCSQCLECVGACELNAIDHGKTAERFDLEVAAIIAPAEKFASEAGIPGIYYLASGDDPSKGQDLVSKIISEMGDCLDVIPAVSAAKPAGVTKEPKSIAEPRVGIMVCKCGGNISEVVSVPRVMSSLRGMDGIAYCGNIGYACSNKAPDIINDIIKRHNLTHVLLAACSCCSLDQICYSCTDRRVLCKTNLLKGNDARFEFVNIREQCAWVHRDQPAAATAKAVSLIKAGIARIGEGRQITGTAAITPVVNTKRCRGCGTCVDLCQFKAITLKEKSGVMVSQVDESLCRGCGLCVARCPSGALQLDACSDEQIKASVEAILS